jgi:hypothetical protein
LSAAWRKWSRKSARGFGKPLEEADTGVFLKADISTSINGVTNRIDVAIAEATASTHVLANRAALIDGAACAVAEKNKMAKSACKEDYTFFYREIHSVCLGSEWSLIRH